jgi:hypothetical protein
MPYPKTSLGYPVQMKQLIRDVALDQQAREITLPDERTARGLRSKFYQLLGAIKRDVDRPSKLLQDDPAMYEDIKDLLRLYHSVEFKLDGNKLIVRSRDNSPNTEVFNTVQILKQEAYAVPASEQSGALGKEEGEMLQRLLETQSRKEKKDGQ